MNKFECTLTCTISICCTIVLSVLIIAGGNCVKHVKSKKAEVRQSALEKREGIIIMNDRL